MTAPCFFYKVWEPLSYFWIWTSMVFIADESQGREIDKVLADGGTSIVCQKLN